VAIVSLVPAASEMIEPSLIRNLSLPSAGTSTVSVAATLSPSLSGVELPPRSTVHCPCKPTTLPAAASAKTGAGDTVRKTAAPATVNKSRRFIGIMGSER
jgi:hypothetical protein